MIRITPAASGISYKVNKLADRVGNAILKHMMESTTQWREVKEDKKMNIGVFYLTAKADIWWNAVKDRLLRPDLT